MNRDNAIKWCVLLLPQTLYFKILKRVNQLKYDINKFSSYVIVFFDSYKRKPFTTLRYFRKQILLKKMKINLQSMPKKCRFQLTQLVKFFIVK